MSNDGVVITLVKDTDIVSAVLSFLAVLTSGVTLYLTLLRRKAALTGAVGSNDRSRARFIRCRYF